MSWSNPFVNFALKAQYTMRRGVERIRGALGGKVVSRSKEETYTDPLTGEQVRGKLVTSGSGRWEGSYAAGDRRFVPQHAQFVPDAVQPAASGQSEAARVAAENPTTRQMRTFVEKANAKLAELHTPKGSEPTAPRREIPAQVGRSRTQGGDTTTPATGGDGAATFVPEVPALGFVSWTKSGSAVTGVVLRGGSLGARVIIHQVSMADDGTLTRNRIVMGCTTATDGNGDYPVSLTNNATNRIYARLDAADPGAGEMVLFVETDTSFPEDPPDGDYFYVLIAQITLASGVVTDKNWQHVGDVQTYMWDMATVVTDVTLSGDLTSGYTLTKKQRDFIIGPMYASGASY